MAARRNNWHTSTRLERSPEYWRNRARVLRRALNRCQIRLANICTGTATQTDHIKPVSEGGTDAEANLRAACAECNAELNYRNRRKGARKTSKPRLHQPRGLTSPKDVAMTAPTAVTLFASPREALAHLAIHKDANVAIVTANKAQADLWRQWHPNLKIHAPSTQEIREYQDVLDLFGPDR